MQRMISHAVPLPACRNGHPARHIHECRGTRCGGGHLVECACSHTGKHAEFDEALVEWCGAHGHPLPQTAPQRSLALASVTQLRAAR